MKVQCPKCNAGYQVDEEKIPEKGTYTRCKKCQTRFLIQREPEEKEPGIAQNDQEAAATLLLELITKCAGEELSRGRSANGQTV